MNAQTRSTWNRCRSLAGQAIARAAALPPIDGAAPVAPRRLTPPAQPAATPAYGAVTEGLTPREQSRLAGCSASFVAALAPLLMHVSRRSSPSDAQ